MKLVGGETAPKLAVKLAELQDEISDIWIDIDQ